MCGAGFYSNAGAATCTACVTNASTNGALLSDHAGVSSCRGNGGYWNCASGTCQVAGAGYYSPNFDDTRSPCGTGTFSSSNTAAACTGCSNTPANAASVTYAASSLLTSNSCPYASVNCSSGFYWTGASCDVAFTCGGAAFADQSGLPLGVFAYSNVAQVSGINIGVGTGAAGATPPATTEWRSCNLSDCSDGTWTTMNGGINPGMYLQIRFIPTAPATTYTLGIALGTCGAGYNASTP